MEMTTGLGMMAGPLIGSGIYILGGYSLPFYIFTIILIIPTPIIIYLLPSDKYVNSYIQ